jgi:hypothetical protein
MTEITDRILRKAVDKEIEIRAVEICIALREKTDSAF